MQRLDLAEGDIDMILSLIQRKIEKVSEKEIDESMLQYKKQLEDLKKEIEVQVS